MNDPFTELEQDAWDAIMKAMGAIIDMDERGPLKYNGEELAEAVHVLQSFVKQHLCFRIWGAPQFSDWWGEQDGEARNE